VPHVQITWVEGRSVEQKRAIAERITTVLIEGGKAKRENIHVAFHDVPATNYADAGVLATDQDNTEAPRGSQRREKSRFLSG
jgi:4-oxalocrotonate tautomerase